MESVSQNRSENKRETIIDPIIILGLSFRVGAMCHLVNAFIAVSIKLNNFIPATIVIRAMVEVLVLLMTKT